MAMSDRERGWIFRERRRLLGICLQCGKNPAVDGRVRCAACIEKRRDHRSPQKTYHRQDIARLRAQTFAAYGGKCACCGEATPEFLSVDHIDGYQRASGEPRSGATFLYRWLRRRGFPPGFQVLCFNCNLARGFFGRCPHETQR